MTHSPRLSNSLLGVVLFSICGLIAAPVSGQETMKLADGKLTLNVPKAWKSVKPAINFIEYEYALPAVEGDKKDGRLTVMGAGGSIDANIERWMGQFVQAEGTTKEKTKTEDKTISGQKVKLVDISGAYLDKQGGPFAPGPTIERANYRMLAAIIQTPNAGNYFLKLYGPAKTIEAHEKGFRDMVDSLQAK